ncbi:hypothetical protein PYW08_016098 [Mythimna loreyi]|uniref:Uncharacterized protein n=1 Tax=Mythimna loreyi TaxID=667449 RepID=A0ACC2QSI6_9NEOP|nr:hypothetical protein PYW08_016098 [Mythimna loreyi]
MSLLRVRQKYAISQILLNSPYKQRAEVAEWLRHRLTSCRLRVQTQPCALLGVIYFITTVLKTVKESIVRKPACPRNKNSKTCDIHQVALGPRGGLWPIPFPREEACVPAVGT